MTCFSTLRQILLSVLFLLAGSVLWGADLFIGAESADITPDRPVLLQGQHCTRIAYEAETPITANVLAMESRDGDKSQPLFWVSIDVCSVRVNMKEAIYRHFAEVFPDMDPVKTLILCATHTHTSIASSFNYALPEGVNRDDILMEDEAAEFLAEKIVPAIKRAWEKRVAAQFSYGLGNAVIAFNRRSVYEDGSAVMYGDTRREDFRKVEGMEDHDVGCVFFWDMNNKLLAMMVNPSCPAQEVEGRSKINADYWHPVREKLHAEYGDDVVVLAVCGAAGDLSPHIRYRNGAMDRMTRLRNPDISLENARLQEIARKIVTAVDEVYPVAEPVKTADVPFVHEYKTFDLPQQTISAELYEDFKKQTADWKAKVDADPNHGAAQAFCVYNWTKGVVDRYEAQQGVENPIYTIDSHFVRLGDIVFATNPFELYTDFAVQMKARAKAAQTFVVQLCAPLDEHSYDYVPSAYAEQGGGYGAIPQSNSIGSEGGQLFTEKSIEAINSLFNEEK